MSENTSDRMPASDDPADRDASGADRNGLADRDAAGADPDAAGAGAAAGLDERDGPDAAHRRPEGLDDKTVEALGKLSEALEVVEHARGYLYGFHRLTGKADLALGEAVGLLRDAGHDELAERIDRELVGRNVIEGRWTFQIVEDYDDNYYGPFRSAEKDARDQLAAGRRHLFEAEMKEDRRTHDLPHHEARPS